ncbi:MAG: hypothetical protein GY866_31180 [Proteobacteria bacterium]|nr:hypothetical protein [Pseudomonadota bacterium]
MKPKKIDAIKTISARVSPITHEFFEKHILKSSGSAAKLLLSAFPSMYDRTIQKAKELFDESELSLILEVHNGYAMTAGMLSDLSWKIKEGIKYEDLAEKWSVDRNEIVAKAESLSPPECFIVELWANSFWYADGLRSDGNLPDLEKYIEKAGADA